MVSFKIVIIPSVVFVVVENCDKHGNGQACMISNNKSFKLNNFQKPAIKYLQALTLYRYVVIYHTYTRTANVLALYETNLFVIQSEKSYYRVTIVR